MKGMISDREIYPFNFTVMTTQSTKPTSVIVIMVIEGLPFQGIGQIGFTCIVLLKPHRTLWSKYYYYVNFIGKRAEAQRCEVSQA